MILLTLTTSTDRGGFAIFKNGKLLVEKSWMRKSSSSETVIPALNKALKSKKLSVKEIQGIVLDVGPGSFTGCRISACVAKTLAEGLDIPLYSTTSLDALIFQNQGKSSNDILALIDAHKSLLYALHFKANSTPKIRLMDFNTAKESLTSKSLVVGVYPKEIQTFVRGAKSKTPTKKSLNFPNAQTLGKMFFAKHPSLRKTDWSSVEPLYIRAPLVLEKNL